MQMSSRSECYKDPWNLDVASDPCVGWYNIATLEFNNIANDQLFNADVLPGAISEDKRSRG